MPESCCAIGCQNRRKVGLREPKSQNSEFCENGPRKLSFYRLPADDRRRDMWLAAIKRKDFQPSKYTRLCSEHFISGEKSDDPLSPDYVPSVFDHMKSPTRNKRRLDKYQRTIDTKRKRMEEESKLQAAVGLIELTNRTSSSSTTSSLLSSLPSLVLPASERLPSSHSTQPCNNSHCNEALERLGNECKSLRTENLALKQHMKSFDISPDSLSRNDERVKVLTGLPTFAKLMVIFNLVLPYLKVFPSIDPFKQLLLTLIRLRFSVALTYLALTFGISVPTASRVFNHCIDIMYIHLVPLLVFWPDRTELKKSLPLSFRTSAFQKCACIIDCFEIFIDRPANLKARAQTYSSYKSHNTIKYLIGITPQGTVSFISLGWGGRTSDKFITENSGFLNNVQPGDVILADRGFDMHDTFGVCQAQLKIPAFTRGKKQLDPVDIESTRGLAAVRIHVERVIGTVRQKYSILRGPISMSFLECAADDVMPLDKIVHICCALTNVCPSVVPSD